VDWDWRSLDPSSTSMAWRLRFVFFARMHARLSALRRSMIRPIRYQLTMHPFHTQKKNLPCTLPF
jgi:hypothetical protein